MHTLLLLAVLLNGLVAGATLDKALVGLPARKKIGSMAFATYFRATDLGPGTYFYPIVGLGGPILTIVLAILNYTNSGGLNWTIVAAAGCAVIHLVATTQAAPQGLKLRNTSLDEKSTHKILKAFARWNAIRAVGLIGLFLFSLMAV